MNFNDVERIVNAIPNGQLFKVEMITSQEKYVSKKTGQGYEVFKHSFVNCRKGVKYSNLNYIKEICEELGYVIGERKNGTKDVNNNTFADSKLGNKLIDLFLMDCIADRIESKGQNINKPKTEYIVKYNGTETVVTLKELEQMGIMQPSYFKSDSNKEKYEKMITMRTEYEMDKLNYPTESKIELAKLIRYLYNKMFSPKVDNIISIG